MSKNAKVRDGMTKEMLQAKDKRIEKRLKTNFSSFVQNVTFLYECEFYKMLKEDKEFDKDSECDVPNLSNFSRLVPRSCASGAISCTFVHSWEKESNPDESAAMLDVNGCYGAVGLLHDYPVGNPIPLLRSDILDYLYIADDGYVKRKDNNLAPFGLVLAEVYAPEGNIVELTFLHPK